ncbi:MAG TPA: MFS transporter, partial [Anaerolineae bacterium]
MEQHWRPGKYARALINQMSKKAEAGRWQRLSQAKPARLPSVLFISNFVIFFIGAGLLPVLPLYAAEFGATPTVVGLYLAFTYISITVGTMLTGWLSERVTYKMLFVSAGVLGAPALALLGQATALWQVILLTAIVWFTGGVGLTLVSILTGLCAEKESRGKSFGLMFLANPLAAVTGGLAVGQMLAWQGYPLMFAALGLFWVIWPVVVLFGLEANQVCQAASQTRKNVAASPAPLGSIFYLVLLAVLLSSVAVYIGRLGTSLSMHVLDFSPSAVASTAVIGGLVTIPITPMIGTLSDGLGRKRVLILGYLLATGGALILSMATQLWHFWLETALLFIAISVNGSVAAALATDVLAP